MSRRKSEFGRGYATCLIQFTFHLPRLYEQAAYYAKRSKEDPANRGYYTPAQAAEMWMNGASDHLYELVRPRGITKAEWAEAQSIQARALSIGHGFGMDGQPSSDPEECASLVGRANVLLVKHNIYNFEQAMTWDGEHGLAPLEGEWACKEPMKRRDKR